MYVMILYQEKNFVNYTRSLLYFCYYVVYVYALTFSECIFKNGFCKLVRGTTN